MRYIKLLANKEPEFEKLLEFLFSKTPQYEIFKFFFL